MSLALGVGMAAVVLSAVPNSSGFTIEDNGAGLVIQEGAAPVLVYNYRRVPPPPGVPDAYGRSCYIHPLYGLDAEILTEDFPTDHRHHRGLYWAWPVCKVGNRSADIWISTDIHQHHAAWLAREASQDYARVEVENVWTFDDKPEQPVVREVIGFIVHSEKAEGRAIDFTLQFINISREPLVIRGQTDQDKGYGGFCFRPDAARKPFAFTAAQGVVSDDALRLDSPWVDMSSSSGPEKPLAGVAIFQHPANPDYPHDGWILRHYGFLGASWPHNDPKTFAPGEAFTLRYRVYVHRGSAEDARLPALYEAYVQSARRTGEPDVRLHQPLHMLNALD